VPRVHLASPPNLARVPGVADERFTEERIGDLPSIETLRTWVRQAECDAAGRPGLTTDERQRLRDLEKEVKELRRANEILKAASAFFGAELDRRHSR
jgi:transposase